MRKNDKYYNLLTYIASAISVLVLGSIIVFLIAKGSSLLNFDLLVNDYWPKNYLGNVKNTESKVFENEGYEHFSSKWGLALKDEVNAKKEKIVVIEYIDPDSPLSSIENSTAGSEFGKPIYLKEGYSIEKIDYINKDGQISLTGNILKQDAKTIINNIENTQAINSLYVRSEGLGIRSSLITTLYLIGISLLCALPIGIMSAIYLHEYAGKSRFNRLTRQGIETLTGVPSIVFGLMGVTVLFPITQLVGANTTSILLGGLTMMVILLPTIIKATEEALIVVPQSLRDASLSLGATKSQTIFKVILPCCVNGILTGVLLSIGRVIGESAALVYTMGTFINDSPEILAQGTSLSLMIFSFMSGEQPNFELAAAISLVILIIVLVLNIIVKVVGKRFAKSFN